MQRLLMIAPAPVIRTETGYILDKKFWSGMEQHCGFWDGQMDFLLREGAQSISFGAQEVSSDLEFGLKVLDREEPITVNHLSGYDVVYCGIDEAETLGVIYIDFSNRPRLFATIEYTLRTRLQAAWLNTSDSFPKRLRTMFWLIR